MEDSTAPDERAGPFEGLPASFLSGSEPWTDAEGFFWDEPGTLLAASPNWLGLCGCGRVDENCAFAFAYSKATLAEQGSELIALAPESAAEFLAQILTEKTGLLDHGGTARASFPSAEGVLFLDGGAAALEGSAGSAWLLGIPGAPELAEAFILARLREMDGQAGDADPIVALMSERPETASAIFLAALSGPIGLIDAEGGKPRLSSKGILYGAALAAAIGAGGLTPSRELRAASELLEIEAASGPARRRPAPSV